jgi:O-antigen/teichoic acid export membrane protein
MSPPNHEALPEGLVKQRAKSGVFFVGSLGLVNLTVGFVGSIVLARMLVPHDFGVVAIGTSLIMAGSALGDGGLASGLIRREAPPTRGELRAALALQLALTGGLALVAASLGFALGGAGEVVALMMLSLPASALQTPARIHLWRALRFGPIASSEAAGVIASYVWSISGVLLGFDVWALASGVVMRSVVSSAYVIYAGRLGLVLPSLRDARALRPVVAFGLQFQAVSLAALGRDQGLNTGVAAIAGVSTLGVWTLTKRLLELPVLLFEPLHRVSFPLMSHMRAARQDPARLMDRGIAIAGTASALVLVAFAAAASELVPAVFGEHWRAAGTVVPWVCAALLVAGPLSVVGVGFLYAGNEPSVVVKVTVVHTIAVFAVAFPLLPVIGPEAIGMGSLAGAIVDACMMARAIARRSSARPLRKHLPTLALAAPAALTGMAVTAASGTGLVAATAGGLAAAGVYLTLVILFRRAVLIDTAQLIAAAVRSGLTRERAPQPAELGAREPARAPA